jgi:hypothetical protein
MKTAQIDVVALAQGSYRAVFSDFKRYLDIAWPWLGLSVLAVYGVERLVPAPSELEGDQIEGGLSLVQFILSLINLVAMCCFLAKWTRWLIHGEVPEGVAVLRFGRRESRVVLVTFGAGLLVGIPMGIALLFPTMLALSGSQVPAVPLLIVAGTVPLGVFFWLKLSLAPVLAALDLPGNAVKASWYLTKNAVFRLFSLVITVVLPAFFVQLLLTQGLALILGAEESALAGSAQQGVLIFIAVLFGFLMMSLVISAQILAVRELMSEEPANPKASAPEDRA